MIRGIFHVNIVCSNLDASLHFYRDLLGARVVADLGEGGLESEELAVLMGFEGVAACKGHLLRFGKEGSPGSYTTIDLLQWIKPQVVGRPYACLNHAGIARICLPVEDVDAAHLNLKENGVAFVSAPMDIPVRLYADEFSWFRICLARDPDGVFLELSGPAPSRA